MCVNMMFRWTYRALTHASESHAFLSVADQLVRCSVFSSLASLCCRPHVRCPSSSSSPRSQPRHAHTAAHTPTHHTQTRHRHHHTATATCIHTGGRADACRRHQGGQPESGNNDVWYERNASKAHTTYKRMSLALVMSAHMSLHVAVLIFVCRCHPSLLLIHLHPSQHLPLAHPLHLLLL